MNQEHIFFTAEKHIARIRIADIMFIECHHRKVRIFCTDDVWDLRISLDQLQSKLPENMFVRIHRSYLVALHHITLYINSIVYMGDFELPVQNGKVNEFKAALNLINRDPRNRSNFLSKYKKL